MTFDCYPYFNTDALLYSREEKQGCMLFQSKKRGDLSFQIANRSANEIAELSNGKRAIQDIAFQMAEKYPAVDPERIIDDIHSVLRQLDMHGLIEWKNCKSPFENEYDQFTVKFDDHTIVRRADERDYEIILNLIQFITGQQDKERPGIYFASPKLKDIGMVFGSLVTPGQLELLLRSVLFSYSHFFYILTESGEPTGLFSLIRPFPRHCSISVGFLILVGNDETGEKIDWFLQVVSKDTALRTTPIHQIRFSIEENDLNCDSLVDAIELQKFEKVGILPEEYGENASELVYTRAMTPIELSAFRLI